MTNKKDFRINARLTEDQFNWYKDFAKKENIKVSELLRLIPEKHDNLKSESEYWLNKIKGLEKQIKEGHGYSISDFL